MNGYPWCLICIEADEHERHRYRKPLDREVRHRILEGGRFEERVYENGRLVDVRRFMLGAEVARSHVPRHQLSGRRVA